MATVSQVVGVLLPAVLLAAAAAVDAAATNKKVVVPAMYVFGDSTADVGNNNYLPGGAAVPRANFPHNGVDFPTSRPTGRFSNGYNGVDFLALHMGFKRSPPPFLAVANKTNKQGVNLASAGSGILDTTGSSSIIPLSQQVEQFASLQRNMMMSQQGVVSRSLFVMSTGGNDLFAFFSRNSTPSDADKRRFIGNLVSLYENHVKALYVLGARKLAVIDVPPIGCCPYPRSLHPLGACIGVLNDLAVAFNGGLRDAMRGLASSLLGLRYSVGSSHAVVQSILKHPQRLGFKDVTTACCGSGRFNGNKSGCTPNATLCHNRHDHLFWDLLHPTHAASKIAAAAIYNGSLHFAAPVNLRQLVEDQS